MLTDPNGFEYPENPKNFKNSKNPENPLSVRLPKRLLHCAGLVGEGASALDVGTDHALLPCYLISTGRAKFAYASDVAEGPLKSAERTVSRLGLGDRIALIRSDGLKNIPREILSSVSDVIISGMGGELIAEILGDIDLLPDGVKLILQPNSRAAALRKFLAENGTRILSESAVRDGKFIYPVIHAEKIYTKKRALSELEAAVGELDPTEPVAFEYLLGESERIFQAAKGAAMSRDPGTAKEAEGLFKLAKGIRGVVLGE